MAGRIRARKEREADPEPLSGAGASVAGHWQAAQRGSVVAVEAVEAGVSEARFAGGSVGASVGASVGGSVGASVGASVGGSVGASVEPAVVEAAVVGSMPQQIFSTSSSTHCARVVVGAAGVVLASKTAAARREATQAAKKTTVTFLSLSLIFLFCPISLSLGL